MPGRKRGKVIELHISLLPETEKELKALMIHERETYPSRVIDRAIHKSYTKLPNHVREQLEAEMKEAKAGEEND